MPKVLYLISPEQALFLDKKIRDGIIEVENKYHIVGNRKPLKAIIKNVSVKEEPRLLFVKPFCRLKRRFKKPEDLYILDYKHIQAAKNVVVGKKTKVTFDAENFNMTPEVFRQIATMKLVSNLATKSPTNIPAKAVLFLVAGAIVGALISFVIQGVI